MSTNMLTRWFYVYFLKLKAIYVIFLSPPGADVGFKCARSYRTDEIAEYVGGWSLVLAFLFLVSGHFHGDE